MGFGNSKQEEIKDTQKIPDNISLLSKSIAKISYQNELFSGFLIKFFKESKDFFCLITTEEAISKNMIKEKDIIKLFYDNESKMKTICLNSEERFIKNFKDIGINSTVIEILPGDEISKDYFLLSTINYVNNFKELQNEEIFIIQYPKGIFNYSTGKIEEIDKYEFTYSINTKTNIEGNPILLKGSTKVIGMIKAPKNNESKGDFIGPIFNFFQNFKEKAKTLEEKSEQPIEKSIDTKETNIINGTEDKDEIIKYENGNYYKGESKDGKREGKGTEYNKDGTIKYEGDWANDMPEGNGKLVEIKGIYYIGQFKQGLKHGKGKLYNKKGELILEGDYVNGKAEGFCKFYFVNGDYFEGETKNGMFHGKGKLYYKNGNIMYEGSWINDKKEGFGKFYDEEGFYYEGEFKNGTINGKGKKFDKNGKLIYEGDWVKNTAEGNGKLIYDNGYYYIGQVKDFKRHGKGIEYYEDGSLMIEGDWIDDLPDGYVKYIDEEGEIYEGHFKEGKKHGKGKKLDKKGKLIYEGDWVNNRAEGNGKLVYDNGYYYIGQFKDDYEEGKGKKYNKNGRLLYEGDYVNGSEEGNGKYFYEDGGYYVGQFKNGVRHGKGIEYDKNGKQLYLASYKEDVLLSSVEEIGVDSSEQ